MNSELSRRTVLKGAGAITLLSLGTSAGSGAQTEVRPAVDPQNQITTGRFEVRIDDVQVQGWEAVTIPGTMVEQTAYREGNDPDHQRQLWGQTNYGDLTMRRVFRSGETQVREWRDAVTEGRTSEARKTVTVELMDETGAPQVRWDFEDAWVKAYDPITLSTSQEDGPAMESVSVTFGDMTTTWEPDSTARTGETPFSATNDGGKLVIGGTKRNDITLEQGQFQITGVVDEANGTWESTDVEIGDIRVSGLQLSASAPNGLGGEFDRDTGTVSIEGKLVVSTFSDELELDIAGSTSGAGQSNLEERSVELVDDTFLVEKTGSETINQALGLPADEPGENRLELPLELDLEGAEQTPPTVDIDSLSFEGVPVGQSETKTTTITNTGDRPLDVSELTIDDDSFTVGDSPGTIEAGEAVSVSVTYAPSTPGTVEATLNISAASGTSAGNTTVQAEAVEPSTPEETTTQGETAETTGVSGPGFGIESALVSLGSAGYLLQRRLSDDDIESE
jgi:phage tail-like protein